MIYSRYSNEEMYLQGEAALAETGGNKIKSYPGRKKKKTESLEAGK